MNRAEPKLDEVVAEIQTVVAARRAAGDYPVGLEQQLESYFDQMLRSLHATQSATSQLSADIDRVGQVVGALSVDVGLTSKAPGGAAIHKVTAALVRRHTQNLLGQVGSLGAAVHASLNDVRDALDKLVEHGGRESDSILSAVMDRLAIVDHLATLVTDLEQRVATLEQNRDLNDR